MPPNTTVLDVLFLVLASITTSAVLVPDLNVDIKLRQIQFHQVRENSVFDGEILGQVEAQSSIECGLQCIKSHSCNGINYEMETETQRTKTSCELIRRPDGGSNIPAITERQGWKSYVLKQNTQPNNGGDNGSPEFCDIQAAFVYKNQIYLLSGETVYTFTDVTQLLSGPIKTVRSTDLFPGMPSLVTAIYTNSNETQVYLFEDDTVQTYSPPGSGLQWGLLKTESQSLFWGKTYSGVTGVFSQKGNVVVLLGDRVTQLGEETTCKYASFCSGNVLMSNNKEDAPGKVTACFSDGNIEAIMFYGNLFYSFARGPSETKGTWTELGRVKCH